MPTCTPRVALACPTGPCWSRRWWCGGSSAWSCPAALPPDCWRSLSCNRWRKMSPEHIQTLRTSLTSVPLLWEESAAKRGCKHQAGGQKDGGGCFRRRYWIKEGSNVPSLTTDPQAPLELERLKLGIATGRQDGRTTVSKMGGNIGQKDPQVSSRGSRLPCLPSWRLSAPECSW